MPADVADVFQTIESCIQLWHASHLEELILDGSMLKSEDGENVGMMTRGFDTYGLSANRAE